MPSTRTARRFRQDLLDAGLLRAAGADGVYHRSGTFERIVRGIEGRASAAGRDQQAAQYFFPPIIARDAFERTDYLRSFPDLIGSVSIFTGDDADHAHLLEVADEGGDWSRELPPSEVMLCSAACHPLYPNLSGTMSAGAIRVECQGYVFRHEPSLDPARMQSFRQHEFVYVGEPQGAVDHRDLWLARGLELLAGLGLEVEAVVANDPFFGRAGRMLAANQRDTALKYEIVASITSDAPTAITSANCHEDHFGAAFAIRSADGEVAHTACIGFGLERIALALISRHGLDPADWPVGVREQLWP